MDKDALTSVGVIALLLIIIVVAAVINSRNELVVSRPRLDSVVSATLEKLLGVEPTTPTGPADTCPNGCVVAPTPAPAAGQKAQLQADPIPYLRDELAAKFASQLREQELESTYAIDTQLWWRSPEEGYRIIVPEAKTLSLQVPTTAKAYQLAPSGQQETHPALRHPTLDAARGEIVKLFKKLDFKQSAFKSCPINEAYDPFDNCVATFTHEATRCSLTAGYGKFDQPTGTSDPYLRLEVTCSTQYQSAYQQAAPYLYALAMINPEWYYPDLAVEQVVHRNDGLTMVDLGERQVYFQEINGGLRLLGSQQAGQSCALTSGAQGVLTLSCG